MSFYHFHNILIFVFNSGFMNPWQPFWLPIIMLITITTVLPMEGDTDNMEVDEDYTPAESKFMLDFKFSSFLIQIELSLFESTLDLIFFNSKLVFFKSIFF